jgi:cytoskeleton protein RodZ
VLPGATCVKGFLRTYAIFLKLDGDALVDAYRNNFEPKAEETPLVRTEVANQRRMPTSVERKKKRVRRHQRGYALVAIVAIVVVALLAWFGASRGDDTASIGAENISTSTVSTVAGSGDMSSTLSTDEGDIGSTAATQSVQATVSSSVDTPTATDSVPSGTGTVKLVVKVTTGSCWLVIREDGENGAEVYAGTLSEGGKQTFESARRYWMNVGQPEALTVSVGGKSYTLAAPAGAFVVTETGIERSQ